MLFHKIGWLPLIRAATRLISRIRQALASARARRMEGGKNTGEEEKQRLFEGAFVPEAVEENRAPRCCPGCFV